MIIKLFFSIPCAFWAPGILMKYVTGRCCPNVAVFAFPLKLRSCVYIFFSVIYFCFSEEFFKSFSVLTIFVVLRDKFDKTTEANKIIIIKIIISFLFNILVYYSFFIRKYMSHLMLQHLNKYLNLHHFLYKQLFQFHHHLLPQYLIHQKY